MRAITLYPQSIGELTLSPEKMTELGSHLSILVEDALASRKVQDALHNDLLRMYEGVPKNPTKYSPIMEGFESIEVTLGAIATDSIYAQVLDLIYTVSPLVTCRALDERYTRHAKAMQRFVNFLPDEMKLRAASEHQLFDTCQLGTGIYYVPWREQTQKASGYMVKERGPVAIAMPPEDVVVFGGSIEDVQAIPLLGLRFWYTKGEMEAMAKFRKWDISAIMPTPAKDWVTQRRQVLANSIEMPHGLLDRYEIFELYYHYDIDGDGHDEDLLINWDRTSKSVLRVRYNPYENRPVEISRYQIRAHMFYGIGVMEMLRSYQNEITELHNHQILNVMLANCRMFATRTGTFPDGSITVYPGRNLPFSDPQNDIKELHLADIYSSLPATQAMVISLAERRVGVNDMNLPRPSQVIGSRTPGITTMSMLQQVNKRFTPAFDQMRMATSGAIVQGVYRYSELIRDGNADVRSYVMDLLGEEDALLVLDLLKQPNFKQRVAVELTASSASVNREADRQNSIMLVNLLGQYYEKALQLVTIASNPQVAQPVRDVAQKIATAAGEVIERTIRTFDQVRDPATFIVNISAEIDAAGQNADQQAMLQMYAAMLQGGQPSAGVETGTA